MSCSVVVELSVHTNEKTFSAILALFHMTSGTFQFFCCSRRHMNRCHQVFMEIQISFSSRCSNWRVAAKANPEEERKHWKSHVTCSASRAKAAENWQLLQKWDYIKNNGGIMLIGLSIRVDQWDDQWSLVITSFLLPHPQPDRPTRNVLSEQENVIAALNQLWNIQLTSTSLTWTSCELRLTPDQSCCTGMATSGDDVIECRSSDWEATGASSCKWALDGSVTQGGVASTFSLVSFPDLTLRMHIFNSYSYNKSDWWRHSDPSLFPPFSH